MKPLADMIQDLDRDAPRRKDLFERLREPWPDQEEAKAGKTAGQSYVEQAERQAEEDKR